VNTFALPNAEQSGTLTETTSNQALPGQRTSGHGVCGRTDVDAYLAVSEAFVLFGPTYRPWTQRITQDTRRNAGAVHLGPRTTKTARGLGHSAVITWEFSKQLHSTLDMGELLIALDRTCEAVSSGELGRSETLLTSKAVALNSIQGNITDEH
jgi:hypothetical protein